jgi:hypothetical protein
MTNTLQKSNNSYIEIYRNQEENYHRNNIEVIDTDRFKNMIVCLDKTMIGNNKEKNIKLYLNKKNEFRNDFFTNIEQSDINKPFGLWYSCGVDWYNWSKYNLPEKISNKRVFTFKVDYSKILKISSEKELLNFNDKYSIIHESDKNNKLIDWKKVTNEYDGIEICPFFKKYMFEFPSKDTRTKSLFESWYSTWSVASGCIWNKNVISEVIYGGIIPKIKFNVKTTAELNHEYAKNLTKFLEILFNLELQIKNVKKVKIKKMVGGTINQNLKVNKKTKKNIKITNM